MVRLQSLINIFIIHNVIMYNLETLKMQEKKSTLNDDSSLEYLLFLSVSTEVRHKRYIYYFALFL